MKNQKLKTTLTAVMIITLVTTLVMCLVHLVTVSSIETYAGAFSGSSSYGYLYEIKFIIDPEETTALGQFSMDWDYAGIFVALLFTAFITWVIRTFMFTIPTVREGNSNAITHLICEILVGIGLILAIIALFIPLDRDITILDTTNASGGLIKEDSALTASGVMGWMALPMATISGIASVCLNRTK